MTNEEILKILREEKDFLKANFGLLSIGLFGSCAKGINKNDSDIDLLIELSQPRFDYLAAIQIHLEKKLGKRVDLIRKRKSLSGHFMKLIEKDIQYV